MKHWQQLHPKSVAIDENVLTVSIWLEWATNMKVVAGVNKRHTFWLAGEPAAFDDEAVERKALQWEVQW